MAGDYIQYDFLRPVNMWNGLDQDTPRICRYDGDTSTDSIFQLNSAAFWISGTVLIPTASPPRERIYDTSAGVSYDGPKVQQ